MAWSPSKLPDVLALTCGWSSTSVMCLLSVTPEGALFLPARLFTLGWLALSLAIAVFTAHPGAGLVASTGPRFVQYESPFGLWALWPVCSCCRLFCAVFDGELRCRPRVPRDSKSADRWLGRTLRSLEMWVCVVWAMLSAGTLQPSVASSKAVSLQRRMGLKFRGPRLVAA